MLAPNLSIYKVTFRAPGIADVVVLLDETPTSVTGGYGGWTVVSRLRRVGLTQWQGKDPIRIAVPIIFDGYKASTGCELDISRLSRMALPPLSGGEPPVIKVLGRAIPKPGPDDWVIESIQWGTSKVIWGPNRNGTQARLRQDAVINLLEYRGDDRVAFSPLTQPVTNGASKAGWPKTYVIKPGDTIQMISSRFYKNPNKWRKIADANNATDPRSLLQRTTITIPAP